MMPRIATRLTPLVIALAMAGCALGPDYVRPAAPLPAAYAEADQNAEQSLVNPRWWTLFQDADLDDLVDQALKNNADLRQAIARVEQADAVAREAGAALLPAINGDAGITNSKASTRTSTYVSTMPRIRHSRSAALSTSYEIDIWGRARRTREASQAALLASEYSRDAIRLSIAGLVASNYLALRALDAQLAVSSETLASREESLKLVRSRNDAGLVSPLDLHQAESSLAAVQAQQADLRRQRALTEHQLALIVGQPDLKLAPGDVRQLPLPPAPPAGLPAQLVEARPDVRQAEQELVAANAGIGVAKAGYFPRFTLTGSLGSESKALGDLFSAGAGTWALGLGATVPLLDFGRTTARVDQAKALTQQSLIGWEQTLQTAYKEVRDALVSLRENGEAETAQGKRYVAAKRSLDLANLRYESGYVGYLEVLDAQRSSNDALTALIATRQARLASAVDLFKALGGGWKPE
ncbi:MAG: efflux system, outer rane lipoprotein, NodT [Proteobacteria bacterium]|nr:efflux system, outer rane lipoprotein, NodT [Pseudomonadota bacterium]